ncbi:MAG TPA: hypothetical protein DGT21_17975 [Armatimonadetes bacterium]|nr:hypothetical protein [Armatimonadota bacterium]
MSVRMAFAGFRHGHVTSLYKEAQGLPYVQITGAVEDDDSVRGDIMGAAGIEQTHESIDALIDEGNFDLLCICDYYTKRGGIAIKALEAGKHLITDKPLCTTIEQMQQIKQLADDGGLAVHIAYTMRYGAGYQSMARIVQDGGIGRLCTAIVLGQHPLAYGSRPNWYFEEGKHGGTINDLFGHGTDMIGWASGLSFEKVIAAEAWNARADWAPFFQDSAQIVYQMSNGAKLMGDCSYLTPEGSHAPWRFFLWGTDGYVHLCGEELVWEKPGQGEMPVEVAKHYSVDGPVEDIAGHLENGTDRLLGQDECLRAAMAALAGQKAADTGERDMPVPVI